MSVAVDIADPEKWTVEHTQSWVDWIVHEFDLQAFDLSKFNMTGQQLCSLSKEDFLARSPPYTGDVLFVHLLILRRGVCCVCHSGGIVFQLYPLHV